MKIILIIIFTLLGSAVDAPAQTELLTNNEIILMTKAGLSKDLIRRKIQDSRGRYETTTESLIELKKAGVDDDVIALMMDAADADSTKNTPVATEQAIIQSFTFQPPAHVVLGAGEALKQAKTIAIEKSTLNPSRQALEKELLKRAEWQRLNLNIVRHKDSADLFIEIGFVPLSVITHRYVFRVYDRKSGTVIAAGETTSWGSLTKNLAREISKKLAKI